MSYDDRPLWEQSNNAKEKPKMSDSDTKGARVPFWTGLPQRTHSAPSWLLRWYEREYAKLKRKEFNEIDVAEMKAARKGVINRWTPVGKENAARMDKFLADPSPERWEDIKELIPK